MRRTRAFPVVVSGPSGVGKTTLVNGLLEHDPLCMESVSMTTRAPRDGEIDGADYFFVTEEAFERHKKGDMIEWAQVHKHYYGTPKSFVDEQLAAGIDVVMNIDVQGGASVKKVFSEAVLVFILPPSLDVLEARIRDRGTDDPSVIDERLKNARWELTHAADYNYLVVNDDLDQAVAELTSIVAAERDRRERYDESFTRKLGI